MLKCPECGWTATVLQKTGRYGCSGCYSRFGVPARVFFKAEAKIEPPDSPLTIPLIGRIWDYVSNLSFAQLQKDLRKCQLSIRYRLMRNLKGFPFRQSDHCHQSLISLLRSNFGIQPIPVQDKYQTIIGKGQFYFFEEDHLRWQGYIGRDRIFSVVRQFRKYSGFSRHFQYGYLAACPTNSGRGDKLSVLLNLENLYKNLNTKHFLQLLRTPYLHWRCPETYPIIDSEHTDFIFFLKNVTRARKINFLRYIYFLYSLNKTNNY